MQTPHDHRNLAGRQWAPCEAGQLLQFAAQVRSERRTRMLGRVTLAVALLAVVGLAGFYGYNSIANTPQPMACKQVLDYLPAYAAGEVDQDTQARIDYHLSHCTSCQYRYRQFGLVSRSLRPAFPLAALLLDALQ